MSYLAHSILLAQLIATLIHYPCTVALTGLADWSAFSRAGFANHVRSRLGQWGPWRAPYRRYGSDIHPRVSDMSLRPSRLVWAYEWHFLDTWNLQTVLLAALTRLRLPTRPHRPPHPPPARPPPITCIRDITAVVKKLAQNPAVPASYC